MTGHKWTRYEKNMLVHLLARQRYQSHPDPMALPTQLNKLLNEGDHGADIPWREVRDKAKTILESRPAFAKMLMRSRVPKITRTLMRSYTRGLRFTGAKNAQPVAGKEPASSLSPSSSSSTSKSFQLPRGVVARPVRPGSNKAGDDFPTVLSMADIEVMTGHKPGNDRSWRWSRALPTTEEDDDVDAAVARGGVPVTRVTPPTTTIEEGGGGGGGGAGGDEAAWGGGSGYEPSDDTENSLEPEPEYEEDGEGEGEGEGEGNEEEQFEQDEAVKVVEDDDDDMVMWGGGA